MPRGVPEPRGRGSGAQQRLHRSKLPQAFGGGVIVAERSAARFATRGEALRRVHGSDRLSLMKTALHEFVELTVERNLPHAGGLLLCGTEVVEACALTPAFSLFQQQMERATAASEADDRGGVTRLYEALCHAADALDAFRESYPSCEALRIVALTDGEDTTGASAAESLHRLERSGITLDCVALGGAARRGPSRRCASRPAGSRCARGAWARPPGTSPETGSCR